jgi:glycine/D-amino acid oxidase-like deaminating enzyme
MGSIRASQLRACRPLLLRGRLAVWPPAHREGRVPERGHVARPHSTPAASASLPQQARVVVVGGGIIGSSIAYHLAHAGWKDVVLLERDKLTSGTTWHAAGLMVTFGSTSATSTSLRKYSRDLYSKLESETGLSTGFEPIGFIELATTPGYLEEFRRVSDYNRLQGVDVQEIGPADVQALFPLCKVDDVLRGFYVAGDGRVNPVDATMSLVKGARQQGAKVFEGVAVSDVLQAHGRVAGVRTECGHEIKAEYVVNCAGMWARQLAAKSGVSVPLQAAEHYYLITDAIPEVDKKWPVVEDPSSYAYIRREGAGLMVGLFEPWGATWRAEGIPQSFSFGEIPADLDRVSLYFERAMQRVPRTLEAGVSKLFCGPESFTADLRPIVGPAPELENYWVAAGMNSIGILTGDIYIYIHTYI